MNIKNISEKIIRYISKEKKLSSKQVLLYCYTLQMLLELVLSTTITLVLAACCNTSCVFTCLISIILSVFV